LRKFPNFEKNIAPEFKDVPYDPKRKYSMPYTWLSLGIGYRKSKVKGTPDSWKVLFDSDEYKGRIAVLSEAGDMFRTLCQISRQVGQRADRSRYQDHRSDDDQAKAEHQGLP
jgi:hypothetical protein